MQNFYNLTVFLDSGGGTSSVITGGQQNAAPADGTTSGTAADPNGGTVPAGDPGLFGGMWIWIIYIPILVGAYFLMTRPQRKREKQLKEAQAAMRVGDEVVTAAGFFGRIAEVGEDSFSIEFGTNRPIRVPVLKSDVLGVRSPKMTPPPKDAE